MRALPPLWLAQSSRYAGIARRRARLTLALLALLVLVSFTALLLGSPEGSAGDAGAGDLVLYEGIVAGMRSGGGYYEVAADQLRALDYPLRPFLTFRLPTLAVVQAALPPFGVLALMLSLSIAAGFAWLARLMAGGLARPAALVAAAVLLAGGLVAFVQWPLWPFHEFWAAPLVALSLAARRPGLWLTAAALGLAATLIRETAALYLVVMAGCAWFEGQRREAFGWGAALGVFAIVLAAHAWAASHSAGPLDAQSPGWAGLNGPGLFVRAIWDSSALQILPLGLAAPIVALAAFGWSAWNDPTGLRVTATIAAYALVMSLFARLDTFYWGLMATPLILVGLAFLPDGLRDLTAAAMDTRRVRVQRITR
ncbi:hypothetical protein [Sphingomonas sp. Y38-1Y]|uniref:hypothetical protein n=1 Tax=Sphingomonas sp. Y38-1Y TaxID=3078265 RepID=UPI0028E34EAA|nr:hypothetical protein [Sphingomonas sp. Y38-1Y]